MENTFWSIHKIPEKTHSQIEQKVFWLKFLIIVFYVDMALSVPLACLCRWYPHWYFLTNESFWEHALFMFLFITGFVGGDLICYLHIFTSLYFYLNINVQMLILSSYFENITDDVNGVDDQTIIRNRLLVGIKQHVRLRR